MRAEGGLIAGPARPVPAEVGLDLPESTLHALAIADRGPAERGTTSLPLDIGEGGLQKGPQRIRVEIGGMAEQAPETAARECPGVNDITP
jgi:hypothetical protein